MKKKSNTKIQKISYPEEMDYGVSLSTDKEKNKYIKRIESIVRTSMEYKDYINYLRENVDMTKCAFFNNVDSTDNRKIKIEVHHEPLTLYNIVKIIINKHIAECIPLNDLYISDEVMNLHYMNLVGLIPLSKTVHQVVHNNSDMVVPLYLVYGDYNKFIQEYGDYIDDEIYDVLENKIDKTKNVKEDSFNILEKQFTYLEIDGISLPQKINIGGNKAV